MIHKVMFRIKSCLTICLACAVGTIQAQTPNGNNFQKMVDFMPPAPNASAIIKHSQLSINKNTGSPGINIPLSVVKGKKLSLGISIGYSSTGLKVDEIASRVGMGWSLTAGGVVSRTMRGVPDEWNQRIAPPSYFTDNCETYNYVNNVVSSANCFASGCNGFDAEPDLFNFSMNGLSGSFVLDENGAPVPIPADKFKIETSFGGTAWNFKITGTDGIRYYFGGTGAVESSKRENSCGKTYNTYIPNSWYLVKIEHPNGEVINLTYTAHSYTYDNGVSQTIHWASPITDFDGQAPNTVVECTTECPTAPASTKCVNRTNTSGVLLSTISSGNDQVTFWYRSRQDCGDKLVDEIRHNYGTELQEKYVFSYNEQMANMSYANEVETGYQYTPYLTNLQKLSGDASIANSHRFGYNDPGARAPRLSFSQDHWGYFNGKVNTTLIPKPKDNMNMTRFPTAIADREPDQAYAVKGMLNKIVYPTGGVDYLEYESNDFYDVIGGTATYSTRHEYDCSVTGTGLKDQEFRTMTFTIDKAQPVSLVMTCIDNGGAVYPTNMGNVEVFNSSSASIFYEVLQPATTITRYLMDGVTPYDLPVGTYTVRYAANGSSITTNVKVIFYPTTHTPASPNKIVGGVRVKTIMTGNPDEKPLTRHFYYAEMSDLTKSSLYSVPQPVYSKEYRNVINCAISNFPGPNQPTMIFCTLAAMYSNSLTTLYDYSSGLISYGSVVESIGENFEGGATQARFYTGSDASGIVINGSLMLGAPRTNHSQILNGKLREEITYKKASGGALVVIKKSLHDYLIDTRESKIMSGYSINQKYSINLYLPISSCPPSTWIDPRIMKAYDIMRYDIVSYWTHIETVTETLYDENGSNPFVTVSNTYFDNAAHMQPTRTESVNSKGETLKTVTTFPSDHTGNTVLTDMKNLNMLSSPVTSKTYNNTTETSSNEIIYGNAGSNNYLPVELKSSVKGQALETDGTIDQYDAHGNILQFTSKDGMVSSVIWGYGYQYPVAKITGATYANATAQLTVSMATLQSMDGSPLRSELNNIRTGIPAAQVTTYTYKPLTGVTSITDANNKTNTYEYDGYSRLLLVKDQDGNAVKKNEYYMPGSNPSSMVTVYFSHQVTGSYTSNVCASGYASAPVTYTVPYGKYFSLISQADADQKADNDNGGQEYANKNALCKNTLSCTGPGYKMVNCACELGTKVCESSNPHPTIPGYYLNLYHWLWSDGTISAGFTEDMPPCTGGIDKKKIGCVCETGTKVCDNVTDNGGGSYTVTYHYHFSDNTNSSSVTETITGCSGPDKKIINCTCETGVKVYTSSVMCTKFNPPAGCCTGMWLCTYRYAWSDGSYSGYYTECSPTSCLLIAD